MHQYYLNHKAHIRDMIEKWKKKNWKTYSKQQKAYLKKWRKKNRAKVNAYQREQYRRTHGLA